MQLRSFSPDEFSRSSQVGGDHCGVCPARLCAVTDTDDITPAAAESSASSRRWIKWAIIGVVATVVLVFGAIFVYANFINDSPDALGETDLSNALAATTTAPAPDATTGPTTDENIPADTAPTTEPASADNFDGDWVPTSASEFGYRVEEVLAGVNTTAVGRSNEIEGLLIIEGTTATEVDVTVQVENITSDDPRRDSQFQGRIMNADEFPTAEFRITEPIDFGRIPVGDEQITATATGELTLRGATNPVTFEVTAQTTDGRIGVLGSIPVVFEDYGIENPSFGVVKTEDNGLVEFVLVFERA
jgi:polyisoprenoid-binding protein YceI